MATNACLDELRRRGRRPAPGLPDDTTLAVPGLAIDEGVVSRLDIDEALARLPVEFRAAVVLRDLMGMDYAEIATTLSIPPGTVRSRIARGRAALATLLEGNPGPAPDRPTPRP